MITRHKLRELAEHRDDKGTIVSLFLNVDGRERSPIRYAEVVHQLTRSLKESASYQHLDNELGARVDADLDAITRYIGAEYEPDSARGLAFVACEERGLFQAVRLGCPLPDGVRIGPLARLLPLAGVLDELARSLVVLVDREKARLFVVEQGAVSELPPIEHEVPGRIRPATHYGLGDAKIERYVDDHIHHHLLQVAEKVGEAIEYLAPARLLVGGTPDVVPELVRVLPQSASDIMAGRLGVLMIIASPDEVFEHAREQIARAERDEEWNLLGEIRDSGGPGGRAVTGIDDTLDALYREAVRILAVAWNATVAVFECSACGRLFTKEGACPACGSAARLEIEDIADAAVSAAIRQDARVEVIPGTATAEWSGLAALLRYPLTERAAAAVAA